VRTRFRVENERRQFFRGTAWRSLAVMAHILSYSTVTPACVPSAQSTSVVEVGFRMKNHVAWRAIRASAKQGILDRDVLYRLYAGS
jgi:hypothetical protein